MSYIRTQFTRIEYAEADHSATLLLLGPIADVRRFTAVSQVCRTHCNGKRFVQELIPEDARLAIRISERGILWSIALSACHSPLYRLEAHPAIINVPPSGVTGPKTLPNRSLASTKPKIENENMVVPDKVPEGLVHLRRRQLRIPTCHDQRPCVLVSTESRMLRNSEQCDAVVDQVASRCLPILD